MQEDSDTQRRRWCEDRGRNGSNVATNQGMPSYQKLEETRNRIFRAFGVSMTPCDTLILGFWPPELWENEFLLFSAVRFMVTYLSSPRKWMPPYMKCCSEVSTAAAAAQSLSRVQLLVTPWTVACQAPLSMRVPRQEYWSGLPFPSPGDLPEPGIKPESPISPALAGVFFTTEPPGKPKLTAIFS